MVRRLKSDLRKLNVSKFPERKVEAIVLDNLRADTPELVLSDMLERYRDWCEAGLQGTSLAKSRFMFSGLQQRLLSCRTNPVCEACQDARVGTRPRSP
jgi:hypothetical protein